MTLEQVDGLDVSEGLERCMNNRILYRDVLLEFRERYGDLAGRLEALFAADQWADAEALTHAVKGTSGMLSANDLYAAATALNATLKLARDSGRPPGQLKEDMELFRRELVRLLTGINKLGS